MGHGGRRAGAGRPQEGIDLRTTGLVLDERHRRALGDLASLSGRSRSGALRDALDALCVVGGPEALERGDPVPRPRAWTPREGWVDLLELLEDPPGSRAFRGQVYRRLRLMSQGPVAVGAAGPLAVRLRRAGWPMLDEGDTVEAAHARTEGWNLWDGPEWTGIGSWEPHLVLVGGRARAGADPLDESCGTRLWRALRLLGWDELSSRVVNSLGPRGEKWGSAEMRSLELACPSAAWVALGQVADTLLWRAGIDSVRVAHPRWHLRHRRSDGAEGYARFLEAGGLGRGDR